MTTYALTTLGEAGLRLSVEAGHRLENTDRFDVYVAGSEANVAATLANLGWNVGWQSRVAKSALGRRCVRELSQHSIDLSSVTWADEGRTGLYFVEYAEPPRPTQVLYDRAGTSFAHIGPEHIEWSALLDTRILHLSGLTAALGVGPRSIVEEATNRARSHGISFSFDVNYRKLLGTTRDAAATTRTLAQGAELLFCSEDDARSLCPLAGNRQGVAVSLAESCSARHVIMSLGVDGVAYLHDGDYVEHPSLATGFVDRLGAGDALAAGFIHAWLTNDMGNAPRIGSVMAALSLSQVGEQVITTLGELERLVQDLTTRLQR